MQQLRATTKQYLNQDYAFFKSQNLSQLTLTMKSSAPSWAVCSVESCKQSTEIAYYCQKGLETSGQLETSKHCLKSHTFAARMEIIATAIRCIFWSSWLHSHCMTSLAASNLNGNKKQ